MKSQFPRAAMDGYNNRKHLQWQSEDYAQSSQIPCAHQHLILSVELLSHSALYPHKCFVGPGWEDSMRRRVIESMCIYYDDDWIICMHVSKFNKQKDSGATFV